MNWLLLITIVLYTFMAYRIFKYHAISAYLYSFLNSDHRASKHITMSATEKRNTNQFLSEWKDPGSMFAVVLATIGVFLYTAFVDLTLLSTAEFDTVDALLAGVGYGCCIFVAWAHFKLNWGLLEDIQKHVSIAYNKGYLDWLYELQEGKGDIDIIQGKTDANPELIQIWIKEEIESTLKKLS